MLITEYINPWHNSRDKSSPTVYKVNERTKQEGYKGYYIVQGVNPWVDVVAKRSNILECANLAFSCIAQVGSVRYAKQWIDNLSEKDLDSHRYIGLELPHQANNESEKHESHVR